MTIQPRNACTSIFSYFSVDYIYILLGETFLLKSRARVNFQSPCRLQSLVCVPAAQKLHAGEFLSAHFQEIILKFRVACILDKINALILFQFIRSESKFDTQTDWKRGSLKTENPPQQNSPFRIHVALFFVFLRYTEHYISIKNTKFEKC